MNSIFFSEGIIIITHSEIECFLAIYRYKTITLAAEKLFITQPSLSARLKTLENELKCTLFNRKNGNREMTLTASGEAFYALAVQYESIMNQMLNLKESNCNTIRVSAINSVGTYFLPLVYNRFMEEYPCYNLEIQDMELNAVIESILLGNTDLGFTSGKTTDDRLIQTPVFVEKMMLIVGNKLNFNKKSISISDLKNFKEVYIEWSKAYGNWHKRNFKNNYPRITISIMAQLKQFMKQGECWAIVPISVAEKLFDDESITILDTDFDIPSREISVLTSADNNGEIVKRFFECIKNVVNENNELCSLI